MNPLENKKIFIVGGSSGIGLALGARVIIASRSAVERHGMLAGAIGEGTETLRII